jgi:DNA-binding transcriptional MerR regulator
LGHSKPAQELFMPFEPLRVGELARRTGLTVRTLHHYDEIGLVRPSLHTESGHRRYTAADIKRLQQVLSLRQLGFSLEEIGNCLNRPDFSARDVLRRHIERLTGQIELERKLCERLTGLAQQLDTAGDVSADTLLQTIEEITMIENYYTPEQLASFQRRREEAAARGVDIAQEGTAAWSELLAAYKSEMENGTDPADPGCKPLSKDGRSWSMPSLEAIGRSGRISSGSGRSKGISCVPSTAWIPR